MVEQDINEQLSSLDDGRHFEDEAMDEPEDEDTPEFRASCKKLDEEMNRPEVMSEFQLDGAIYEQVDERMKENISNVLEAIRQAFRLCGEKRLTVGQMIKKWIKSVELGESQKIRFGMPYYVFFEELSIRLSDI